MKIQRFHMEDWLIDSAKVAYNLGESGCQDFYLSDFLKVCDIDIHSFNSLFLGNNDTKGSLRLRQEICQSYQTVKIEEILVTNGSSESLFVFFNELLDNGDEVVVPFPTFQCLYQIPHAIGCNVKFLPLLDSEKWRIDFKRLETIVTSKTKLLIINTPHNPIGWTLSVEELSYIAEIAMKNECYLLFDEHYRYLPLTEGTSLIPSGYDICLKFHDKTYATGSMIKCFGIVGIRIGWLLGKPEIIARCRDYKDYITHTIPEVTDYIAYLALRNKERIITAKKAHILQNLKILRKFMRRNSQIFEYHEPTGGVVCFPKLKHGKDSRLFCQTLRQHYDVSLLPGFAFEVDGHFRINFGIDSNIFRTALQRIQSYIDKEYFVL